MSARSGLVPQFSGAGFVFSVWAASLIAPHLSVENAFAVALIFAFLVFSNVWGYLNAQFARLIDAVAQFM